MGDLHSKMQIHKWKGGPNFFSRVFQPSAINIHPPHSFSKLSIILGSVLSCGPSHVRQVYRSKVEGHRKSRRFVKVLFGFWES